MWSHLTHKHPSLNVSKSGNKQASVVPGGIARQTSVSGFLHRGTPLPTAQQESFTRKLSLMCALDLKPLSVVQGRGFRMFCNALNPRYQVPAKKTVAKYLHVIYEEEKEKLINEISGNQLSATTDLWTSNALQGYITVTGHYISSDWALHSKVLATRVVNNRHTGVNIAMEVENIFSEFKLSKPLAIVTDNAARLSFSRS